MKISIIIPNYNNGKFLKKCIDSILCQTFKDFEIIVVDDGSTDESKKILHECDDNRITKIFQYNQNAAIARNRALEIAKGEYVYFLDSDDELYDKDTLENIINDIKDNDLLIGNYVRIFPATKKIERYVLKEDYLLDVDNKNKYLLVAPVPSNKLYRHDIIKRHNLYFDNVKIGQDLNFYLKYLCVSKNVMTVDYNLYKYRVLDTSMSRAKNLNFLDIYNVFIYVKKFYDDQFAKEIYDRYMPIVELMHYNSMLNKLKTIKNKKMRRAALSFLKYCINNIDFSRCVKDRNYREFKFKVCIRKFLYY